MSSSLNLPIDITGETVPVANQAALPPTALEPIGAQRTTLNDGALWQNTPSGWVNLSAGAGAPGIFTINGDTSAAQTIAGAGIINVASAAGTTTISAQSNANTFAGFDGGGAGESIPGWNINDVSGANVDLSYQPNNLADFFSINNFNCNVDPLQASVDDAAILFNMNLNLDPNNTGFRIGTNGTGAYIINANFNHQGKSSVGTLGIVNSYSNIGNGTDAISVKGMVGYTVDGDWNNAVVINGGMQGFAFQPILHPGCFLSSSDSFCQIFYDGMDAQTQDFDGYYSFNCNANLGGILNNNGFTAFQANPKIGVLHGDADANMFFAGGIFSGSLGDGTGGGYTGFQLNPEFTNLDVSSRGISLTPQSIAGTANFDFININSSDLNTTGQIQGIEINMRNTETAINSQGHHNLSSNFDLQSGLGQQYGNVIGGQIILPDSTAITGTDTLANNFAFGIHLGNSGSSWVGASPVGLSCVGFVGFLDGDGSTSGGAINFCLGGFQAAHTGSIERINNFNALAIPGGGGGTVGEHALFAGSMPFGFLATKNWGIRIETDGLDNSFKRLCVSTTTETVTNASCGIELGGTTQAVRFSNLTTAQRTALTALAGMQVFDTDLNQMAYYNGSTWVIF